MKSKGKLIYILISVILGSILISIVDGVIRPEYFMKSIAKISVFPVSFVLYFIIWRDERKYLRSLFRPATRDVLIAFGLGAGVLAVVLGAFFLFRDVADFSAFTRNLSESARLTTKKFLFVAVYICIINSLMEELFFRGLAFVCFGRQGGRISAYFFSALLFALYHTGMTAAFVEPWVFLLMLVGLFLGGLIFNFVDERSQSILPSWLCHFFANLATTSIGYMLLCGL